MLRPLLVLLLLVTIYASASPVLSPRAVNNGITKDAPFSEPKSQLDALPILCPNGVQKKAGKNILFIHGTGGRGDESWSQGLIPAFYAQGYNGCYVNLPNRTLGDAQVSGEYVVSAIQRLYKQVGNKQILLIGHSQGNLNIQWALNYWPQTARAYVANYVSLAGDFQGTAEGPIVEAAQDALINGTAPSVIQQSVTLGVQSNFLKALNKRGNEALVPTTSTYGLEDEVIQPVIPDTMLGSTGAPFTHVAVQTICPTMVVDHFEMLINTVAFYLALDAFAHGTAANVARVTANSATICAQPFAPGIKSTEIPAYVQNAFNEALAVASNGIGTPGGFDSQSTKTEPPLKSYALE